MTRYFSTIMRNIELYLVWLGLIAVSYIHVGLRSAVLAAVIFGLFRAMKPPSDEFDNALFEGERAIWYMGAEAALARGSLLSLVIRRYRKHWPWSDQDRTFAAYELRNNIAIIQSEIAESCQCSECVKYLASVADNTVADEDHHP